MSINDQIPDDHIVDLEEHFLAGRAIPKAKKYRIRIDKEQYVVEVPSMTGTEILALASKTPDKYLLRQKTHAGVKEVAPTEVISFEKAGIERFMTIPNEVTEGEGPQVRRLFTPLANDRQYLDSTGLRWEVLLEGGLKMVVLYDWPLPEGYNVPTANVHVRLTDGYPDAQIDMAYFSPALSRADGRNINALSPLAFDGQQWQQWSRHRTTASAWRPGIDDLSSHMALVEDWLLAELKK
jgi:hypothetical protein